MNEQDRQREKPCGRPTAKPGEPRKAAGLKNNAGKKNAGEPSNSGGRTRNAARHEPGTAARG